MQPIDRYALERHAGPYEGWPPRSRLVVDGVQLQAAVPGYVVEAQYATSLGTLLVTSFDCPFEEANCFLLLDEAHRIVARTELGAPYGSWLLHAHWPAGDGTLALHYSVDDFRELDLLPPGGLWNRPRLRLRPRNDWRDDPRMVDSHARLASTLAAIADARASEAAREAGERDGLPPR